MAGIYLHIPFCKQACYYCDFHFSTSLKKIDELIECLLTELEIRSDELNNEEIQTIYFGGGTPSLLSQTEIDRLIDAVHQIYKVVENPEITLEANPDDLSEDKILELAASRVNRLSIGVQSFFESDLKLMNRAHNAQEAKKCLRLATQYFDNISLDLIYGIPGASDQQWQENIQTALDFAVPHISSYALTVEPKTALASFIEKGIVAEVNDVQAQRQFETMVRILESEGFEHYELSNFGKQGYFSQNNSAYWQGKSYLGIGPSAHSFDGQQRSWNVRNNSQYIKALQQKELPLEREMLTITDRYNEYVMTRLRTQWGVVLEEVETDFGKRYREYLLQQAKRHILEHLLYIDEGILRTTKKGKFLSDGIAADLFKLNLS